MASFDPELSRWSGDETLWFRCPRYLAESKLIRRAAIVAGAAGLLSSIFLVTFQDAAVRRSSQVVLGLIERDADLSVVLEGLEPSHRAALPARLNGEIARVLPRAALLLAILSIGCAVAATALGAFLRKTLPHGCGGSPVSGLREEVSWPWAGPLLASIAGLLAQLPFLRLSLNLDEAWAALHATQSAWAWANTVQGWQSHVGAELLMRVSTAIFGISEWSVRAPSVIASCIGLGIVFSMWRRAAGALVAALTVAGLCALPLWAEVTTQARGYGLTFLAASMVTAAVWRIAEGKEGAAPDRLLALVFVGTLVGFLAHFFFVFFSAACFLFLSGRALRRRDSVAGAACAWIAMALVPGALLYLPGLAATLRMMMSLVHVDIGVLVERFRYEVGFRQAGAISWTVVGVIAFGFALGIRRLSPKTRGLPLVLVGTSLGIIALLRPVYFYPRFLTYLLPLAGIVPLGLFPRAVHDLPRRVQFALAGSVAFLLVFAAVRRPPQMAIVDLRAAARAVAEASTQVSEVVIDNGLAPLQFYLAPNRPAYVNTRRAIPAGAAVWVQPWLHGNFAAAGATVSRVLPGRELDISISQAARVSR